MLRHVLFSTVMLAYCQVGFGQTSLGKTSLGQIVQEWKVEWLVGDWQSETGTTISYRWALNKHALISEVVTDEWASRGMTVYDPGSEQVKLISANDRGALTTGYWEVDGDNLVLRLKTVSSAGESIEFGVNYAKSDDDTIALSIHGLSDGRLRADSFGEFILKRKQP